ncbi:hypothetical protein ACP4OV_010907 [Aristida adscensionis]
MLEVVVYIGCAFKVLEDKGIIYIPFHFANHWICIMVDLELAMAWVLDSMDKDLETYKDFLTILKSYPCHKQRSGSGHCGYYVMEFMNAAGTYKRHPELPHGCPYRRRLPVG